MMLEVAPELTEESGPESGSKTKETVNNNIEQKGKSGNKESN